MIEEHYIELSDIQDAYIDNPSSNIGMSLQELTPELLELGLKRLRQKVLWMPRISIEKDLFKVAIKMQARNIAAEQQRSGKK